MRTATEPTFVETSNVGETKRATIQTSSKIFNFFSKQIYSDFFTACWRELVANAIDAQKMNGETRPPVVTAPSMLEPYAKVRDFGCSMDHDFMMNKFMAFGDASTKEDSDDFIGGFGIGSKAPLAYTDQYSIRCYLDGVVRVYSIFKDEEGCPSIAFLSEDKTDEPNGVEVGFPVRQNNIESFTKTLDKTLQYFKPQPILEGTELELNEVQYDAKGDRWGIRSFDGSGDRAGRIIVGGIAYPLVASSISYNYPNIRKFSNFGLDLFLDIGDVNIALSREQVTHDDDLAAKLEKIVANIGPEYGKQISKKFENAKTLWEAKELLGNLKHDSDHTMQGVLDKYAVWDGKPLSENIMRPDLPLLYIAYGNYYAGWNKRSYGLHAFKTTEAVSPRFNSLDPYARFQTHSFDMIVWDDSKDKPTLRVRTCIDQNPSSRILFVRNNAAAHDDKDDVTLKDFLESIGNPPATMVKKLSSYKPAKIQRAAAGTAARKFKCFVRSNKPYPASSQFERELPKDGGLYIVMNNFDPEKTSSEIKIAMRSQPKNVVWLNLTDFKASDVETNPLWYSVDEGIEKVKEQYRKDHKDLPEATGWYEARMRNMQSDFFRRVVELSKLSNFPKQGPLLQILRLHEKHEAVTTSDHQAVRQDLLKIDGSKHEARILNLVSEVKTKYPAIAELVSDYRLWSASDDLKNRLF